MSALDTGVRERPILFSGPMVRAILEDRKTKTRRVVEAKASWERPAGYRYATIRMRDDFDAEIYWPAFPDFKPIRVRNRYGQPGDRLWVREAFFDHGPFDAAHPELTKLNERIEYREDEWDRAGGDAGGGWKPSIFMPRWASRLTLEITEVRVEWLQDISEDDAIAEGVDAIPLAAVPRHGTLSRRVDFMQLWDKLNAKRGYGWDANPWVWVIGFTVVTP